MINAESINIDRVLKYFEEISSIPRGSGHMQQIADYCMNFAQEHSLKAVRDNADNVIIYKQASNGYETADAVILQGHLDIVWQKTENCDIDLLNEGLRLITEGDIITADGTTLGADNGIAVAMILAILESETIIHPPIEAVFTTDEEIGMIGASQLDFGLFESKTMINLDSEEDDTATVSCAGGSDFIVTVPIQRKEVFGAQIDIKLGGLKGGHSGVEINSNRVNANILAGKLLDHLKSCVDFDIICINGGDKANAITNYCSISLCTADAPKLISCANMYLNLIRAELLVNEPTFTFSIDYSEVSKQEVIADIGDKVIHYLLNTPNGVIEMSTQINGLVETSLNLGILKTDYNKILLHYALRSNKESGMKFIEEKLRAFCTCIPCEITTKGYYPPWEYNENSNVRSLYLDCYRELFNSEPKIEAIHAGLECGVFAANIKGLDCISIGPEIKDVHTVNEQLSISSVKKIYKLLLNILERLK